RSKRHVPTGKAQIARSKGASVGANSLALLLKATQDRSVLRSPESRNGGDRETLPATEFWVAPGASSLCWRNKSTAKARRGSLFPHLARAAGLTPVPAEARPPNTCSRAGICAGCA